MPTSTGPGASGPPPGARSPGADSAESSLADPDDFGPVFDRYFAEIHDVATALGISYGTVASRLSRARAKLRRAVGIAAPGQEEQPDHQERREGHAGGPLVNLTVGYGSQQFAIGNKTLTLAQLQALPADPAKLEKLILSGGVASFETPSAFLLDGVLPPILEEPVTPAVRAALYEMLAAMPGIKSLGEVTDPAGQQGEAVSYTATYQNCGQASTLGAHGFAVTGALFSSCTTQEILIINPTTGLPLAEELAAWGCRPASSGPRATGCSRTRSSASPTGPTPIHPGAPSMSAQLGSPLVQPSPSPSPSGSNDQSGRRLSSRLR